MMIPHALVPEDHEGAGRHARSGRDEDVRSGPSDTAPPSHSLGTPAQAAAAA